MDYPTPSISDPIRIRALTHPLRLELLDILGDGPATATECAEMTGESVASCSFHLRMLAKYGFVEEAGRQGRKKPWRLTTPGRDVRPGEDDPESVRAVAEMDRLYIEHALDSTRRWIDALDEEPAEWTQAATITGAFLWATAAELAELSRLIQSLAMPYRSRNDDPSLRPPGSRPVKLFAAAHADLVRERRGKGSELS